MGIYKEIIKINKELGSTLVRPSSLHFACDIRTKNIFKKAAYIIRAVVVDHPFLDYNKSTTIIITKKIFKKQGIVCDEKRLMRGIIRVAIKNTESIAKIEKMLRKCCLKKI